MNRLARLDLFQTSTREFLESALVPLVDAGTPGDDTLTGTDGNDTLDGGAGDDEISGLLGDDSILGGDGSDYASGDQGNDTLDGGAGYDRLHGGDGDDLLRGGANLDSLYGDAGTDRLFGGSGRDVLSGGEGNDTLNGGSGIDQATYSFYGVDPIVFNASAVKGNGAKVTLDAGSLGVDRLIGIEYVSVFCYNGAANDSLTGGGGGDHFDGGSGDDTLTGGGGSDWLDGGAGNDVIRGGAGVDYAYYEYYAAAGPVMLDASALNGTGNAGTIDAGTEGTDTLNGVEHVVVYLGSYADQFIGTGGDDRVYGLNGADTLRGGAGNDELNGNAGIDSLVGGVGDDTLSGGNGGDDDVLNGGAGTDVLSVSFGSANAGIQFSAALLGTAATVQIDDGEGGTDAVSGIEFANIQGSEFDDTLTGSQGNDTIFADLGDDHLDGGDGYDWLVLDMWRSPVGVTFSAAGLDPAQTVALDTLTEGTDTISGFEAMYIYASERSDRITGSSGNDAAYGYSGADKLNGGAGNDTLDGGSENDRLSGGAGNDVLYGGGESDTLAGGGGSDTLTGLEGADKFLFDSGPYLPDNADVITDFTSGTDRIQLENAVYTGLAATGVLAAGKFVAGTAALDSVDRIIYDSMTGHLFYDADGVGGTAQVLVATLTPGATLVASDVWVV